MCAVQLVFSGLFYGLAWLFSRVSLRELWLGWPGWWAVPMGFAYSIVLRLAIGLLMLIAFLATLMLTTGVTEEALQQSVMRHRPDVESLVDMQALRQSPAYFWLTLTVVSFVLGGLREELWRAGFMAGLRALWPQRFGSTAGQFLAAAVAAVLFGLAHLRMGILAVGMTALLGFGLGAILVWHRSIWPAVIAHGAFNATTMALLPWLSQRM